VITLLSNPVSVANTRIVLREAPRAPAPGPGGAAPAGPAGAGDAGGSPRPFGSEGEPVPVRVGVPGGSSGVGALGGSSRVGASGGLAGGTELAVLPARGGAGGGGDAGGGGGGAPPTPPSLPY
jgi:hypothetical protein